MLVEVTQYLRPDGRIREGRTKLPDDLKPLYLDMREHGCRFEAEVLTTGQVSMTISDGEEDIDSFICNNGPTIQEQMGEMLRRRRWTTYE